MAKTHMHLSVCITLPISQQLQCSNVPPLNCVAAVNVPAFTFYFCTHILIIATTATIAQQTTRYTQHSGPCCRYAYASGALSGVSEGLAFSPFQVIKVSTITL